MDWCIKDFDDANHPPVPKLAHEDNLSARSGGQVILQASGSTDPDGDELTYEWFHYREPGSFKGRIELNNDKTTTASFDAPKVSYPQTAHFILKLTDNGAPALTRYKRVIVNLLPE